MWKRSDAVGEVYDFEPELDVTDLPSLFGPIDIYLFDQILRGRITPGMTVFDAGCGRGRNLVFLLQEGYEVFAVDPSPSAIEEVRALARELAPRLPASNFRAEAIESNSFADEAHFLAMLEGSWRLVKPGGLFFSRLASSIGMENRFVPLDGQSGRRFRLPDGSDRFLVDEPYLLARTRELGGRLLDPLKTTVVQDQRCMTTWVMRRES